MLYGVDYEEAHKAFIRYLCPTCNKYQRYPNTQGWKDNVYRMKLNKEICNRCKKLSSDNAPSESVK